MMLFQSARLSMPRLQLLVTGNQRFSLSCRTSSVSSSMAIWNVTQYQTFSSSSSTKTTKFVVSILGPPNAGKSTLFNRLQCKEKNRTYRLGSSKKRTATSRGRISSQYVSKGDAIVSDIAGTTRDRRECYGRIGGTEFILMDTAGVDGDRIQTLTRTTSSTNSAMTKTKNKSESYMMERSMMEQTLVAARESDLILLLWDAKLGVTNDLVETARWLRKLGKQENVVILANKLEGDGWAYDGSSVMDHLNDVIRLGLGEAIPISALQGDGMADIAIMIESLKAEKITTIDEDETDIVSDHVTNSHRVDDGQKPLQIAIVGRQNVGKSTLVNTLLQSNRVLTGPTPGLTRDAIATEWMWGDQLVQLVDTAGIRKLTKRLDDTIEDMSVADALRAMKVAEVVVLVLDAEALHIQRQELAICAAVMEEGRALVIAANKMDLLEMSSEYDRNDFAAAVREQLETRIPILRKTPIVPMSCLTGEGVSDLLPAALDARNRWERTISTGILNRWLQEVATGAPLPVVGGVRAKLKYIIQTKGRPPTFIIFSNVGELPETYLRYLTRQFQESFELFGMPVRMIVRKNAAKSNMNGNGTRKRTGFGLGGRYARMERRIKAFRSKGKANTTQ